MSSEIRLVATHRITATLELRSGLHIGAGKDAIQIGGVDSPVVKNPFTFEPYIPGSSIKGKLRSLLEWTLDCIENDGSAWKGGAKQDGELHGDVILRVFGTTLKDWQGGPTRLMVRDAFLNRQWADEIRDQGLSLTEEKTEVVIDRIQGKAAGNIGPRRMERVPAGARFELELIFKVFDTGDDGKTDRGGLNRVLEALKLLERDALGGSGSRGYGRVRFTDLQVDGRSIQEAFDGIREVNKDRPGSVFKPNPVVEADHG